MSYADFILPEFDQETSNTRKVLERIPEDKLDWRAHPKSNTIGWNANHLAELPGWGAGILMSPSYDIAPVGGPAYESPNLSKRAELLAMFDEGCAGFRQAAPGMTDAQMAEPWSLLKAGTPIITDSRAAMIRSFVISHMIHHRACLCVYLRLNDIAVPGMYGPTGDEAVG